MLNLKQYKNMPTTDAKQTQKNKFPPGNKIGKTFPKGVSGNPQGRPKRTRLTDALREQLQEVLANDHTIAETIARVLIKEACNGNIQAIKEIGDRTEGRPAQKLDIDLQINDWRELAAKNGLTEQDVINEAKLLIESDSYSSDSERD